MRAKKNKSVMLLSSMHMMGEVEKTLSAKSETMDKMLAEYTVKRRTLRWPMAFFYIMIDITGLASCIIYREHNPQFKKKN